MKRWLLWTVRCLRGARCANLVLSSSDWTDADTGDPVDPPDGVVARITYECAGCGTVYESEVLIGKDGLWTQLPRQISTKEDVHG